MNDLGVILSQNRPREIYFVGDSHILPFKNIHCSLDYYSQDFLIYTHYIEGLSIELIFDEKLNEVNRIVLNGLRHRNYFGSTETNKALWLSDGKVEDVIYYSTKEPRQPPFIIFSVGDIDFRKKIIPFLIAKNIDSVTSLSDIDEENFFILTDYWFSNLIKTLVDLRKKGFINLHLLALPYPTADGNEYLRINGYKAKMDFIFALIDRVNSRLAVLCHDASINFINPLKECKFELNFLEKWYLDGCHYNEEVLPIILTQAVRWIKSQRGRFCHRKLYKKLMYDSKLFCKKNIALSKKKNTELLVENLADVAKTEFSKVKSLISKLTVGDFNFDVLDWEVPELLPVNEFIEPMIITSELVDALFVLFYDSALNNIIQNFIGSEFSVLNCRAYKSFTHQNDEFGPQKFHYDMNPDGIFRGIIYLTDVDAGSGPFTYEDKNGKVTSIIGPAGTIVLFDANKILHKGLIPEARCRFVLDIIFLNKRPDMPNIVIANGHAAWPLDPYSFSLEKAIFRSSKSINRNYVIKSDIAKF